MKKSITNLLTDDQLEKLKPLNDNFLILSKGTESHIFYLEHIEKQIKENCNIKNIEEYDDSKDSIDIIKGTYRNGWESNGSLNPF